MNRRRICSFSRCAALLLALSVVASTARAQETYPSRPVRIVSGFAVGGSLDLTARIVAEQLAKRLGQNFVVDVRTGAGGAIAAAEVAKAKPDGYTLLLGFDGTLAILPNLTVRQPFDSLKDFEPISMLTKVPLMVAANPSIPARNIADLIALSKAKPGTLVYATSGLGTTPHPAGELLRVRAGMNWTSVPYRGGAAAITDVISGTTPLIYSSIAPVLPYLKSGQLVPVGIASEKRWPTLPDMPTFADAGIAGGNVESWYALMAPAGTPRSVVDILQRELQTILKQPDVVKRLVDLGLDPAPSTPDEVTNAIKADLARWKQVIKDADIRMLEK